jgi:hypothetical protein
MPHVEHAHAWTFGEVPVVGYSPVSAAGDDDVVPFGAVEGAD